MAEEEKIDLLKADHHQLARTMLAICTALEKTGKSLAQSRADYQALDEHKKVVLAQTFGSSGTVDERKNIALMSEGYQTHMMALEEARKKFYTYEMFHKALESKFEAMRTLISLRKQEMSSGL